MRHINGVYTQMFNRRHDKVGHLFQGRFKAILVDRDAYLLELCRYVDLNPVRARMVRKPEAWAWSSYRAHVGLAPVPAWLDTEGLQGYLLGRAPRNSTDHDIPKAQRRKSRSLAQWLGSCESHEEALYRAHTQSALSMSAIARELGLSVSRVSRLIARAEQAKGKA
jgi:hypothetical protein